MNINLLLLLIVVILISTGLWFFFLKSGPVEKSAKEGPVIFFGNSLTTGVGAGEGQNFPTLIAKELNLTNVINAGVSGDTTKTALKRLQSDVLDHNPALVVVELSGNDFLRRVPTDKTINNLDSITKQIREIGSRVVIVHIKFPRNNDDYEKGFKEIAKKYDAIVVLNALGGVIGNPSLMADNIHPNAAGYKIMAEKIAKVLKPLIK